MPSIHYAKTLFEGEDKHSMRYNFIRNAVALAWFIVFIYFLCLFLSGCRRVENIQGTWRAICIQDELTFINRDYTRGGETRKFSIRRNQIYFGCGNGYPIMIKTRYMVVNGVFYLRVEN